MIRRPFVLQFWLCQHTRLLVTTCSDSGRDGFSRKKRGETCPLGVCHTCRPLVVQTHGATCHSVLPPHAHTHNCCSSPRADRRPPSSNAPVLPTTPRVTFTSCEFRPPCHHPHAPTLSWSSAPIPRPRFLVASSDADHGCGRHTRDPPVRWTRGARAARDANRPASPHAESVCVCVCVCRHGDTIMVGCSAVCTSPRI
jgi:hypothetical protein